IDPNLITHTDPGDLFVLRNAGNLVPAYGATSGGEVAMIEFAVTGLQVRDIVVCGHSHCGAMRGCCIRSMSRRCRPSRNGCDKPRPLAVSCARSIAVSKVMRCSTRRSKRMS